MLTYGVINGENFPNIGPLGGILLLGLLVNIEKMKFGVIGAVHVTHQILARLGDFPHIDLFVVFGLKLLVELEVIEWPTLFGSHVVVVAANLPMAAENLLAAFMVDFWQGVDVVENQSEIVSDEELRKHLEKVVGVAHDARVSVDVGDGANKIETFGQKMG